MAKNKKPGLSRRDVLRFMGLGLLACNLPVLSGCSRSEPLLRISSNVWPGYEFLFLAKERGYFSPEQVRMVEVPSATACLQALSAGTVEGSVLTLDEVITAKADGLELKIVAMLDVSLGADVLLARPPIASLQGIKGKRIGVEKSAVGAVMLDAALQVAGLKSNDVETVYMTVDRHANAYRENKVDAVITFEPVRSELLAEGAVRLFDSADIPGRIIDVLAVLPRAIEESPDAIRALVAGHFRAYDDFRRDPAASSIVLARRLGITAEEVPGIYKDLQIPDVAENHQWLAGDTPRLENAAAVLHDVMFSSHLIRDRVPVTNLIDSRFLPGR